MVNKICCAMNSGKAIPSCSDALYVALGVLDSGSGPDYGCREIGLKAKNDKRSTTASLWEK